MTDAKYESLITEAFIRPIRSVLIVDDDYPTLNEILAEDEEEGGDTGKRKGWHDDRKRVLEIIEQFRDPEAPLLLDIHDGKVPTEERDEEQVGELQQTDLLILDYQLERGVEHGEHALRIARRALSNEHFNLILVHTQKDDLASVFYEFVTGLYEPRFQDMSEGDIDTSVDSFQADYGDALSESLSLRHWALALRDSEWTNNLCGTNPEWIGPRAVLERAVADVEGFAKGQWRAAVIRAFAEMETQRPRHDCDRPIKVLDWKDDAVKFVRTDRGFMAFRSKNEDPSVPLLDTVKAALHSWGPRPSRLLLTKLRAEMDKRGIEGQDDALGRPHIGAIWYRDLLRTDELHISAAVDRTVRNHAEQLLDQILPGVSDFAHRMMAVENPEAATEEVVDTRFGVDLTCPDVEEQAVMEHNAFVGSKPVSGDHLELGHILEIDGQIWLCVTPACDLVPGQASGGNRPDKGGGFKRFTALSLREPEGKSGRGDLLRAATRGGRIFANLTRNDGKTVAHAFQLASKGNAQPAWVIMYAENDGLLSREGEKRIIGVRFVKVVNGELELKQSRALVVGHLRPEYALDLQARLTGSQSRIGLDLKGLEAAVPDAKCCGESVSL